MGFDSGTDRETSEERLSSEALPRSMSYQDTTYIIFDGDKDRWAYARMKVWKALENIDFDFRDAHDLRDIRDWSCRTP